MSWLHPGKWILYGAFIAALMLGIWRLDESRQQIGYDRAQAEYTVSSLLAEKAARDKEHELQAKLTKAQNDAKIREEKLAIDAGRARAAVDSLRNDLASFRASLPALTRDAVNRYADAASVIFSECSRSYSELAETSDRIDSDRQTLMEAWPK